MFLPFFSYLGIQAHMLPISGDLMANTCTVIASIWLGTYKCLKIKKKKKKISILKQKVVLPKVTLIRHDEHVFPSFG